MKETRASVAETAVECVVCLKKKAYFTVGWLVPTRKDAFAETSDKRPACSVACALKVVTP